MHWSRVCGTVLLAALVCLRPTQAAIIADYQADWLPGSFNGQTRPARSADGWDYMWNATGAIGTAAGNYSSLMWWSGQNHYNRDGAGNLPRANPCAWANLNATGGHPGRGTAQGAGVDRFAIAAYTVQAGESGFVALTNSSVAVPSGSSNGVEFRVYVNDTLVRRLTRSGGGATFNLNGFLGYLNVGDRVFVCGGPNTTDGYDSFNLAFRLETASDANTYVWDADGVAPINGGAGGWDTSSARWVTNSGAGAYATWSNAANLSALFPASGGNVTIDVPLTARSLIFAADGYTLSGSNAITLTNAGAGGAGPNTIAVTLAGTTASISAPVVSAQSVTKIDEGTLTLLGSTAITGDLRVGGGTLVLGGSSVTNVTGNTRVGISPGFTGLPTFNGILTIQDSAVLNTQYIYMGENLNTETRDMVAIINQTGGTVTTSGVDGEGNGIRVGHWPSETSIYNLSGGTLTIGNNAELALAIDGTGIFNLSGTGVLNTRTFVVNARTGGAGNGTWNVTGGTANIGAGGIINEGTGPAAVNLGGGTIRATAGFSSSLPMTLTGTNGNITFDTNGFNIILGGNLTGVGGLTKTGDGTLRLSGNNTYTGATSIQGGVLDALCNFGGSVTVGPSGGLNVGQGVFRSTAIAGNYTQDGALFIELGGPTQGVLFDWLNVNGAAAIGGIIDVNITQPFAVTPGMYFDIITASAGISNDLSGATFNIHGTDLGYGLWVFLVPLGGAAEAVRLVVSPEPSSLALLAFGGLALWRRRQGRRSTRTK